MHDYATRGMRRVHQRYVSRRTHARVSRSSREEASEGRTLMKQSHSGILGILTCFSIRVARSPLSRRSCFPSISAPIFPDLSTSREVLEKRNFLFLFHTLSLKHSRRDVGRTGQSAGASTSHWSNNSTRVAGRRVGSYKSKKKGGGEDKINVWKRKKRVLMRDAEWARKRRWTCSSPLLLSLHPIKLLFGLWRTWQLDDEVAAAPREALKRELVARARVHVTYTQAHNTHTPASPLSRTCARCVRSYVGVSLPLYPPVRER